MNCGKWNYSSTEFVGVIHSHILLAGSWIHSYVTFLPTSGDAELVIWWHGELTAGLYSTLPADSDRAVDRNRVCCIIPQVIFNDPFSFPLFLHFYPPLGQVF